METKIKTGWSASGIVSLVFGILGIIYFLIGCLLHFFRIDPEAGQLGLIFLLISIPFLLISIGILIGLLVRRKKLRAIVANGKYVWGEVVQVLPNYSVRINGRCLYDIQLRYAAPDGTIHIFRSRGHRVYPDPSIIGKQVKIYYADPSFRLYYADTGSLLSRVIEHG